MSKKKKDRPLKLATKRVEALALGSRIRTMRRERRWRLKDLSERTDLSTPLLSQIETGLVTPPLVTLARISMALRVDLSFWFLPDDMKKGRRNKVRERAAQAMDALAEVVALCDE
ncbi:helix-turn-helix domain-containing protein [Nitrospinae bacterium AH_259_B05_G02_I21]|nr:helix-turn-helix domain-containing protein [Nitrospinae bacterium AH_259_B05_G02_I21]MDA2932424.1 helix-turn-helix domain-containing protein [Nitrospinae bacterium AH-259-F20]